MVHLYRVFENFDPVEKKDTGEGLKEYTERNIKPTNNLPDFLKAFQNHDVEAFANFKGEIDLHIENLVGDHRKMSNADILKTQLQHCENYIEEAIQLGVSTIFLIHGVGKGKLKDRIATLLRGHPDVKRFKNEFHPKYGTGATEVSL